MIGDFKVMGKYSYLQINKKGTLKKLPPIPWYYQLWFLLKNTFGKPVTMQEIEKASKKSFYNRAYKNMKKRKRKITWKKK